MSAIDRLFAGMRIAASGLTAERARVDVIAKNIAHASTTRVPGSDDPYRRETIRFEPVITVGPDGRSRVGGVKTPSVEYDYVTPFEEVLDPGHPDANEEGIVRMPLSLIHI